MTARIVRGMIIGFSLGLWLCPAATGQTPTTKMVPVKVVEKPKEEQEAKDRKTEEPQLPVPGARVTAKSRSTGTEKDCIPNGTTNQDGACIFQLLPEFYDVRAEAQGFKRLQYDSVDVSRVSKLVFQLTRGPTTGEVQRITWQPSGAEAEQVVVVSGPINVDGVANAQTASVGATGGSQITHLPLQARDLSNLALVAPGQVTGGQSFEGHVISGVRPNNIEFVLLVSQFESATNALNVNTKSGTNDLHGSVFYNLFHDALSARHPFFLPDLVTVREHGFGARVGGPIRRDKTFYYLSYAGNRDSVAPTYSPVLVENLDVINTRLSGLGLPPQTLQAATPTDDSHYITGRVDHELVKDWRVTGRYSHERSELSFAGLGGTVTPSATTRVRSRQHTVFIQLLGIKGAYVNEIRVQHARTDWHREPESPGQPHLEITGVLDFGQPYDLVERDQTRRLVVDEVITRGGRHTWSIGVRGEWQWARFRQPAFAAGRAIIPSIADFLMSPPRAVRFEVGRLGAEVESQRSYFSFHASDDWRLLSTLTLSGRLRYEVELPPELAKRDRNNFSPAVSVSWDVFGNIRTVLRAGYGIHHLNLPPLAIQEALIAGGIGLNSGVPVPVREVLSVVGSRAPGALAAFLGNGTLPVAPQLALPIGQRIRNGYQQHAHLTVSQEIPWVRDLTLSIGYDLTRSVRSTLRVNTNLAAPVVQPNGLVDFQFQFLDPRFTQILEAQSSGNFSFHGLQVGVEKRMSKHWQLSANYSFSKSIDETAVMGETQNPQDRRADRGPSNLHRAHRVRLWVLSELPWKFEGALRLTAISARQFNVILGDDLNRDGQPLTDRPIGIGRNTFQGPGAATLDIRLSRKFPFGKEDLYLKGAVEVLNVLNKTSFTSIHTIVGASNLVLTNPQVAFGSRFLATDFRTPLVSGTDFGRAVGATDPRRIQLRMEFQF